MKKFSLILICLTLLLTACGNEKKEPEETDIIETTAAETSVSIEMLAMEKKDMISPWLDLNEFAEEGYKTLGVIYGGGDSVIVKYESENKYDVQNGYESDENGDYIVCIDMTERKELSRINAPVNRSCFEVYSISENGKKTAWAILEIYNEDLSVRSKSLVKFSPDGEYEITENADKKDIENILEKSMLSDSEGLIENEPELPENEYFEYAVPENGEYISRYRKRFYERSDGHHRFMPLEFVLLDKAGGDIIKSYSFDSEWGLCSDPFFTDSYICFFDYETNIISAAKRP